MIRGFRDWIISQFFFSTSSKNCDTTDTTWWSDSLSRWSFLLLSWWGDSPAIRPCNCSTSSRSRFAFFLCDLQLSLFRPRWITGASWAYLDCSWSYYPGWCLPCSQCFWYITHRSLPFLSLRNKGKLSSDRALALVNWSWPCTCLALVFICKPRISLSFS